MRMLLLLEIFSIVALVSIYSVWSDPAEDCYHTGGPPPYNPSFVYTLGRGYTQAQMMGNGSLKGTYFDDDVITNRVVRISLFRVWSTTNFIVGVETVYQLDDGSDFTMANNGDLAGATVEHLAIEEHEEMVGIQVYTYQSSISCLRITILDKEQETTSSYFMGSHCEYEAGEIFGYFRGFYGMIADTLVALGAYDVQLSVEGPQFGSSVGSPWSDPILNRTHPIVNIDKIVISHDAVGVYGIQVDYISLWGDIVRGDQHGGDGGTQTIIDLDPDEVITQIDANTTDWLLGSIAFTSLKPNGTRVFHGPFGSSDDVDHLGCVHGRITGFYGFVNDTLNAIGVYTLQ